MTLSTVALAAAVNYPAPFVQGGTANVAIVYGANSATTDLVAAANIQSSLASALADQASGNGGSDNTIEGDAYALFTSSSPLLLNASINSVRSSVTESNLPTVLADTDFSGNVDAQTTFTIDVGSNPRTIFAKQPSSSDDPQVGILLGTAASSYVYNATATFNKAINFTHADSEGENLYLFGQTFTVSSATDSTDLVLFKSADTVFLSVGGDNPMPSEEVEIDGVSYLVELIAASDTAATIRLTNQATGESDQKEINEAQSKKVLNIEVAIDNADENNFQLTAQVVLGAARVKLSDGSEVLLGTDEDPIKGTRVSFPSGTTPVNLTSLTVQVFAPDGSNDFISPGNAFVDPVFGTFKIEFAGLENDASREEIVIDSSGDDKLALTFTNWQDKTLTSFEWLNNQSSARATSFLGIDEGDERIFVQEMAQINRTAYTVVGNEDTGYLVELYDLYNASGSGSNTYSNDRVKFRNAFDSSQTWEATITAEGTGTVDIGGQTYTVTYIDDRDGDENEDWARLNYPDTASTAMVIYPTIETSRGAKLFFYEPLTINVGNWDGTDVDLTSFSIPDGDGYTSITVSNDQLTGNFTIGSTLIGNGTSSVSQAVGKLNYNFTVTGLNETKIFLRDVNGGNINTPAIVLFEQQDDANNYEAVIAISGGGGTSSNGVTISDVDFTWNGDADMTSSAYGSSGLNLESDDDLYQMMDVWGTVVTTDKPSSADQYPVTISYPQNQVMANVYVAEEAASITGSGGSGGSTSLGEIIVADSEYLQVATKNLIVIGGSCINEVAASLLESDSPICGSSFEDATGVGDGSFLIQTFESPFADSRVATLVAGYDADDTENAATYLRTQTVMTDIGKKYIGTSATEATLVSESS